MVCIKISDPSCTYLVDDRAKFPIYKLNVSKIQCSRTHFLNHGRCAVLVPAEGLYGQIVCLKCRRLLKKVKHPLLWNMERLWRVINYIRNIQWWQRKEIVKSKVPIEWPKIKSIQWPDYKTLKATVRIQSSYYSLCFGILLVLILKYATVFPANVHVSL